MTGEILSMETIKKLIDYENKIEDLETEIFLLKEENELLRQEKIKDPYLYCGVSESDFQ